MVIVDDVNNDQMPRRMKPDRQRDRDQVHAGVSHADLVAGGKVTLIINNGVANLVRLNDVESRWHLQSSNGKTTAIRNSTISWTEATPGNGDIGDRDPRPTGRAAPPLPGSDTRRWWPFPSLPAATPVAETRHFPLKWSDFKASDAHYTQMLSCRSRSPLPADGLLQYKDADGKWRTVTLALVNSRLTFNKGDIDATRHGSCLTFMKSSSRLRATMAALRQQAWRLCCL